MDNFGYQNWGAEDSYDSSPNKHGKFGSQNKSGKSKYTSESFDYDISSDFADSPPLEQRYKKPGNAGTESFGTNRFSTARNRTSVEERTKEILERNKAAAKGAKGDDGDRLKSYQDTYKELMEGIELKVDDEKPKLAEKKPEAKASKPRKSLSFSKLDSLDSPGGGDSLDISAADLEVGALAARRAREKANDRRRRMSLDKAPHTLDQSSFNSLRENSMYARKGSESPDMGHRRSASDVGYGAGMQFSSALSSIQRSYGGEEGDRAGGEFARFGSTGHSDDDIYRMLNVTGGTADSLKFGSAPVSARNSTQGVSMGNQARNRNSTASGRRSGSSAEEDEGGMSDVTQGSREEDDAGNTHTRTTKPAHTTSTAQPSNIKGNSNKPATTGTTAAISRVSSKNADSFYSVPDTEDHSGGGSSGDSEKAQSPYSSYGHAGEQLKMASGGAGKAADLSGLHRASADEEEEYSLDDFEQDPKSPEKPSNKQTEAKPVAVVTSTTAASVGAPSYLSKPPPSQLGLSSPAKATGKVLTPSNSTASLHSGGKSAGLNSVEEIMQRWYTADSDFMQRSLKRIGSGESGFTLDDEDMKPAPAATTSLAEGISSQNTFATVTKPDDSSAVGAPISTLAITNPSPFGRNSATPSPLTTAAPTPVAAATTGGATSSGVPIGFRSDSANSGMSDQGIARVASSNSDYSSDSMHQEPSSIGGVAPGMSPAPATGFTAIATTSAPVVTAPAPTAAVVSSVIPTTTTDSDRTVFDLSDSFPADNLQLAAAAAKPTVQVFSTFNSVAKPGSTEPTQKTTVAPEIPRLFAQRSDNSSYMSLDQLPSFQDNTPISATPESNPTPSPRAQATAYPRELGAAGSTVPGSASPAVSAASRYQDASDDDQSLSSAPSGRDPLSYVMADAEHDDAEAQRPSQKQRRQSWIAPPRVRTKSQDDRPRSAPPRGKSADGLPPRKLSASTAAKIQRLKVLSPEQRRQQRVVGTRPRHGISASVAAPTALSTLRARTSRDTEVLAAQQKSAEAVQRLTQENWRLFRKYERLEFELQDLRTSHQSAQLNDTLQSTTSAVPLAVSSAKNANSKRPKRSPTGIVERIDRGDKASKITKGEQGPVRRPGMSGESDSRPSSPFKASSSRPYDALSPSQDRRGQYEHSGPEDWEVYMEEALQRLKDDNRKLLEREKAVRVREEAVSIREVTVDMREKLLRTGASTKTEDENKKEFFLREEVAILREREQALLRENDALKADRFMQSQDLAAIEDAKNRQSQGLDVELNINSSYEPLAKKFAAQMHKTGVYGSSVLKPALKSYYTEKGKHHKTSDSSNKANKDGTTVEIEMISVSKEDYEKLVDDHATQERLLDAFQHENNRLTKCLHEKEAENQLRSAVYYDEREKLNKELNRQKNARRAAGITEDGNEHIQHNNNDNKEILENRMNVNYEDIPIQTSRKTAEILRMELEMDGTIRLLKEQLQIAEEGLGQRERDLQVTIEKLRKDNRELTMKLTNIQSQQYITPQDNDYLQLQTENNVLTNEISQLKQRLEWFSQNQKLLDTADEDIYQHQQIIKVLKKELQQKGLDGHNIEKLIMNVKTGHIVASSPADTNTTDNNESFMNNQSTLSTGKNNKMRTVNGRNYNDIKKIKELEGVIRDLQDSLRKRHPDSVASLIRAATVSDSVQAERRQQEQQVAAMRQELDDIKEQHEKRLRSLRQEHERIKVQYEKAKEELEHSKGGDNGTSAVQAGGLGGLTKGSSSASNTVKTLSQALNKIRELEEELERSRAFYTKKVEDVQRKAEVQMRALKRGEDSSSSAVVGHEQQVQLHVQRATADYTEKIALLERELMSTAEELGRVKAAAVAVTEKHPHVSFIPRPGSISSPIAASHRMSDRMEHCGVGESALHRQQDLIRMTQHERDHLCASHEQRIEELKRNHDSYITQLQTQWTAEREGLQRRLKDEEERCTELRKELMDTVRSIAHAPPAGTNATTREAASYVIESKSPDMKQFLLMESQIAGLEVRMQRREKELMTAVEDAKSAAATERSRMEALHAQECREKDEQLVRFQHELVQLVAALRHWKLKNSNAVTVDSDAHNLPVFA